MFRNTIFLLFVLVICAKVNSQNAIFVSPSGNNHYIGSYSQPLQSLDSALVLSRKKHISIIYLRKGKYYNVNIRITKADAGLLISNYENEQVILYGGIQLTSFEKNKGITIVTLPKESKNCDFQMILVNETWKNRSRLPDKGSFNYLNVWNVNLNSFDSGGWAHKPSSEELTQLKYIPKDISIWKDDYKNAEISLVNQWTESYAPINEIDTIKHIIKFKYPLLGPPGSYNHNTYEVWNTFQGIKHDGQWFWERASNKIFYRGANDEEINEFVVPTNRNIITIEKGSENITLRGFELSASGNKLQNENYACIGIDPAIIGTQVKNILFDKISVHETNGSAISMQGRDIYLKDLRIRNCGGGGIYINGDSIKVDNCEIDSVGKVFKSAVGIYAYGRNVEISNCRISNVPYAGLCVTLDTGMIKHCIVKNAMSELLDGGAIYCSNSNQIKLESNFVLGYNVANRFTMGIYFDEHSHNSSAINNIVINTSIPVHCHNALNILFENDFFIDQNTQSINSDGSSLVTLNGNLFVATMSKFNGPSLFDKQKDSTKLQKATIPTGITSFRSNSIFSTTIEGTKLPRVENNALAGTNVKNIDKNTISDLKSLLNQINVKQYLDNLILGLTDSQIKEVEMLMR